MSTKKKHIPSGYSVLYISPTNGLNSCSIQDTAKKLADYDNYFYDGAKGAVEPNNSNEGKLLLEAMHKFLHSVSVPLKKRNVPEYDFEFTMQNSQTYTIGNTIVLPTPVAKAFFEFYKSFVKYGYAIRSEGIGRGKNLLQGLNDGTLTMKDFEEK